MNRTRRLTWKYFWEQKLAEIMKGLLIIDGLLIAFSVMAYLMVFIIGIPMAEVSLEAFFILGILGIMIFGITGFLVTIIFKGISQWIESNWDEAKRRAENE